MQSKLPTLATVSAQPTNDPNKTGELTEFTEEITRAELLDVFVDSSEVNERNSSLVVESAQDISIKDSSDSLSGSALGFSELLEPLKPAGEDKQTSKPPRGKNVNLFPKDRILRSPST